MEETHPFIFSDSSRYRISRHLVFWCTWFLFMLFAVHIPANRLPYWQMEYNKILDVKKGGFLNMVWTVSYRQSGILLCHIVFTYLLIYFILPRYYAYKKKWLYTTGILLLLFIAFLACLYFVNNLIHVDNVKKNALAGVPLRDRGLLGRIRTVLFSVIFNFATVLGFAVMIKLMKRWLLKQKETAQIIQEKASAELQLLKAEVHPHFLFNSLNNIYSFTLEGSPKAPVMIQKLQTLFHYILEECKQPFVSVETELTIIKNYIALERIRYGDRLQIEVHMTEFGSEHTIAPLLLIPLVENSFKHGASKMLTKPFVKLNVSIRNNILNFNLSNSKPTASHESFLNANGGLGLQNVKKRLELIYPKKYELQIIDTPSLYSVLLKIVLTEVSSELKGNLLKKISYV